MTKKPNVPLTKLVRAEDVEAPLVHAWQFMDLEQDEQRQVDQLRDDVLQKMKKELEPVLTRQTAILKREAYEEAKQTGYEAGYQAGFEAGQAQGLEKAETTAKAELAPRVQQVEGILNALQTPQQLIAAEVFGLVAQIAVTLAEKIVGQAIELDRQKLIHYVEQAVALLPEVDAKTEVEVHPDDLKTLQYYQQTQSNDWLLKANSQLTPGSCRVKRQQSIVHSDWRARLHELLDETQLVISQIQQGVEDELAQQTGDQESPSSNTPLSK